MNVIKTSIDGVVIIEPRIFEDERGNFFESFSQREFDKKVSLRHFIQYNVYDFNVIQKDITAYGHNKLGFAYTRIGVN